MNYNFVLIAVLALIGVCTIQGYRKGFLRIAVSLICKILVVAVVIFFVPVVSKAVIKNTGAYESLKDTISEAFASENSKRDNSIPENQVLTIRSYKLPDILKNALINNNTVETYKQLMVDIFEDYVAGYLSRLTLKAASFVGVFIVLSIVLAIAMKSADLIGKIPIIKGFNRFLGLLTGLLNGLILTWLFFIVVVVFMSNETGAEIMADIYNSDILTFLFNKNVLIEFLV